MDLTRSEFLRGLTLAAATGTLSRNGITALQSQDPPVAQVTVEDLKVAQKVADVEFTEDELKAILRTVQGTRGEIAELRIASDDWLLSPACAYRMQDVPDFSKEEDIKFSPTVTKRPDSDEDLAFLSVVDLAHLLETKQVTSTELTKLYLARLKKYGPKLRCVAALTEERALKEAARADEEIANDGYRGVLHGIPYGVKDLFSAEGYPTQWGAAPYKGQQFEFDSAVVEMLTNAGAVLVAKLSLGALAMNDVWYEGRTESPWNPRIGSSGSSAGSASATAAGLVAFAVGTETSGSLISPSHNCRVSTVRPTFGSISRYGGMTLSWSMDKVGPICRNATDCAIVFNALKSEDARDLSTIYRPFTYEGKLNPAELNLGYLVNTEADLTKEISTENKPHLEALVSMGAKLKPVFLPPGPDALGMIISAECASAFDSYTLSDRIDGHKENAWPNTFRAARFISAVDYINADRARHALAEQYSETLNQFDAVFADDRMYPRVYAINTTGHPQVLVPLPMKENNVPQSFSIIGPAFSEGTLLGLSQTMLEHFGTHNLRPDMSTWE